MPDTVIVERSLDTEIEAYASMRAELEKHHPGKFVVIQSSELKGAFDTLENAADFARTKLEDQPFLLRRVGATFAPLPASVMYRALQPL